MTCMASSEGVRKWYGIPFSVRTVFSVPGPGPGPGREPRGTVGKGKQLKNIIMMFTPVGDNCTTITGGGRHSVSAQSETAPWTKSLRGGAGYTIFSSNHPVRLAGAWPKPCFRQPRTLLTYHISRMRGRSSCRPVWQCKSACP
jgi:hypothetical protein